MMTHVWLASENGVKDLIRNYYFEVLCLKLGLPRTTNSLFTDRLY